MGVTVNPAVMQVHNMASVMVTATLPPFAQPGTRIDVTAAAIGDATNLQGGILLLTPLKAANGETYAVAQGPVVTGGFVAGPRRQLDTKNHPTWAVRPMERLSNAPLPPSNPRRISSCNCASPISPPRRASSRLSTNDSLLPAVPVARAESSGLLIVDVLRSYSDARPSSSSPKWEWCDADTIPAKIVD